MKITVLVDNQVGLVDAEYGYSLYVQAYDKSFIVDFGSSDLFIKNANSLNLDLNTDFAVISHNHNDHNGGAFAYKKLFPAKTIYIGSDEHKTYGGKHFPHYALGIDKSFFKSYSESLVKVDKILSITDKIFILNIDYNKAEKMGVHYIQKGGLLFNDTYKHEICVCVLEEECLYIISSCSHKGVVNIIEQCYARFNDAKNIIFIGGIHTKGNAKTPLNTTEENVERIAERLKQFPIRAMYLGHCTGNRAIEIFKEKGLPVIPTHAGDSFN